MIHVARNELKSVAEEEAYGEVNRKSYDMLDALHFSERPEGQALLKTYGMEKATEKLDQSVPGAGPQAAAQEAILAASSSKTDH